MRRVFVLSLALLIMATHALAITARWNPSERATGYRVWYGLDSRAYDTVIDVGNATSAVIEGLTEGLTYFLAATAYNCPEPKCESDFSNEGVITVQAPEPGDTTPPEVAITSPANGATVQRKSQVTITAEASDDVQMARVEFFIMRNGSMIDSGSDILAPYTHVFLVPPANKATYVLTAIAYDAAGNASVPDSIQVTSK